MEILPVLRWYWKILILKKYRKEGKRIDRILGVST